MKFEAKEAAVFFIDILGMSALTEDSIDLSGIEDKIDTSIYKIDIDGGRKLTSPNQVIAAWILERLREELRGVHIKYDIRISQLSDCAFIWSESTSDLLMSASELMWKLTFSGVLCRGGLSYGEVIVPNNDNESFGSFVLGDAVTRAAKHEARGKGCRVFTDADAIHCFHKNFPGKVNCPVVSEKIANSIFCPLTSPVDFSVIDEFKWYLYYDLISTTEIKEIDKSRHAMYMAALVSTLMHSPYYAWNSLNKQGRLHLAGSVDTISRAISTHTGHNDATISSEYSMVGLQSVNRSSEIVKKHFLNYNTSALTEDAHQKMREQLRSEVAKVLSDK